MQGAIAQLVKHITDVTRGNDIDIVPNDPRGTAIISNRHDSSDIDIMLAQAI